MLEFATHCPDCGRPVRKRKTSLEDFPGTIPMVNRSGVCTRCVRLRKGETQRPQRVKVRKAKPRPNKESKEARLEAAARLIPAVPDAGLESFLERRRRRGIRARGIEETS